MTLHRIPPHARIALAYGVFATLWILVSDKAIAQLTSSPELMHTLSSIKGTAFVIVTAVLLFYERRHSDRSLQAMATKYRQMAAIVESSDDAIVGEDLTGNIISWNRGAERLFGYREEEAKGKQISFICPPERQAELPAIMSRLRSGDQIDHFQTKGLRKDGQRVELSIGISPIPGRDGAVSGFSSIARDITDRELILEELRSVNEKLKAIIDASPLAIFALDVDANVILWSPAAECLFGWGTKEILGRRYPLVPPEQWDQFSQELKELVDKRESAEYEARRQRKDGSYVEVRMCMAPLLDRDGQILGGMVVAADLTEQKHNQEVARIQQQKLIQADKMASLGLLVSGIAHEINNPNNYILLNAKILAKVWNDLTPILKTHCDTHGDFALAGMPYSSAHDRIAQLVGAMAEGAQRIQRIIKSLKDFARKDAGELDQRVDLNEVIASALVIMNSLVRRSTNRFTVTYAPNLPVVRGNAQQLEQVIINLVTNSCQALKSDEDVLTVSTDYDNSSNRVSVQVCDGGTGIPPEQIPLIMDPFFTTKRDQGGTGLGLSISYSIVKNHGGDLTLSSELGRGTVATITLPVHHHLEASTSTVPS